MTQALLRNHRPLVRPALFTLALAFAAPLWAAPSPAPQPARHGSRSAADQWLDSRHGLSHLYPVVGHRVTQPSPNSAVVAHGRSRHGFADGVWYAPRQGGYVVARPPRGLHVHVLPAFATLVTIGALSYYHANGVYYRALPRGGYEVSDAPDEGDSLPAMGGAGRTFVYPRGGQSAQRQAADEYECHRWAVGQSGFDPTLAAMGQAVAADGQQRDYQRASAACLEGRGYSVR